MMSAYSAGQEGRNLEAGQLNFSIRRISEITVWNSLILLRGGLEAGEIVAGCRVEGYEKHKSEKKIKNSLIPLDKGNYYENFVYTVALYLCVELYSGF